MCITVCVVGLTLKLSINKIKIISYVNYANLTNKNTRDVSEISTYLCKYYAIIRNIIINR